MMIESAVIESAMIELTLNGEKRRVQARDLAALPLEIGLADAVFATALNGEFVPKGRRSACRLNAGDVVEIVAPMQGG
jgi:sulfur carrier protein